MARLRMVIRQLSFSSVSRKRCACSSVSFRRLQKLTKHSSLLTLQVSSWGHWKYPPLFATCQGRENSFNATSSSCGSICGNDSRSASIRALRLSKHPLRLLLSMEMTGERSKQVHNRLFLLGMQLLVVCLLTSSLCCYASHQCGMRYRQGDYDR